MWFSPLFIGVLMITEIEIFNFSSEETSGNWKIINDVVMGGVSESSFVITEDATAKFSGTLSAENNGGFASVRTELPKDNFNDFDGVKIKVKGDGKIYSLRFKTDLNFDGVSYQAKFKSDKEEWIEFKIPFKDFKPTYRGRFVPNQPELKSNDIRQIGILIADEQWGEFEMYTQWIKFYKD